MVLTTKNGVPTQKTSSRPRFDSRPEVCGGGGSLLAGRHHAPRGRGGAHLGESHGGHGGRAAGAAGAGGRGRALLEENWGGGEGSTKGGGWQGRLRTMCRRAPSRAERLIVAHGLFWCNPKSRKECLGMPHPERTS